MRFAPLVLALALPLLAPPTSSAQPAPVPPGRLIDLGGYRLHLNCTGRGTPTVVLSAGAGDFATDWALVQSALEQRTRVCSYDRAGAAWSDLGPSPRSLDQEVHDLHRLLVAAGERGPFVLAGQSLGGMVARLFATKYRAETAGLVLVDAYSEDAKLSMNGRVVRMRDLAQRREVPAPRDSLRDSDRFTAEDEAKARDFMKQIGPPRIEPPFDRLPPAAQTARLWALAQPARFAPGDDYLGEISARVHAESMASPHPLGDLPLVVLDRTRDEYPPEQMATLSKEHREQQRRFASLSSKGRLVRVEGAGHHIHLDRPDAVVKEIVALLEK